MKKPWSAQDSINRINKNLPMQDYTEEDWEHYRTIIKGLNLLKEKEACK